MFFYTTIFVWKWRLRKEDKYDILNIEDNGIRKRQLVPKMVMKLIGNAKTVDTSFQMKQGQCR